MRYVLAAEKVPDQERQYYAGPVRKTAAGRMAHKVARMLEDATSFNTAKEAEAMCKELGGGYTVVAVEDSDGLTPV